MASLEWRLRAVMARRRLVGARALGQALARSGPALSRSQVYRLVAEPPQRISLRLLERLCRALDCVPGDLLALNHKPDRHPIADAIAPPPFHVPRR